jgi:hypothetical protein
MKTVKELEQELAALKRATELANAALEEFIVGKVKRKEREAKTQVRQTVAG